MSNANDLDASGAEQSPPPWQDVARVLGKASERPPTERAAYLDQIEDEAVREEVRALLTHEAAANRLLGASAVDLAGPHLDDLLRGAGQTEVSRRTAAGDLADRSVGPYRILREIGRGGMGRVFLARREDVEALVALKVLDHAAWASSRRLTLFRREQRLLARLDHPGIARFLDARLLEGSNVPYVVMEHVGGPPIDRYCREEDVSLHGRLRLFVDVCDAAQAAHRKLVVHRDLKPSNVLVETSSGSEEGAAPQVKIVDFGIGALLPEASASPDTEEEPGESTSGAATRRLTWAFASPEQVRGEDASTAMDVYALGALLYTLIAGCPPFDASGHSPEETKRQVLEDIPPVPSKALEDSASGTSAPGFAEERFASEDLDAITLQALHKDSSERYGTADELATDVRRFLGGYPVRARTASTSSPAGSLFYRGAKFVRRNAAAVLAASLAALLLLATAGVAFYQADRASEQAHRARAAQSFVTGLFEDADPLEGEAGKLSVGALLDRGAERLDGQLDEAPEVRGELRRVLGTAYRSTGHPEQSAEQFEGALRIERSLHQGPHAHTALALDGLARLRVEQGRFAAADSLHRAALGMRQQIFGGASRQVATSLEGLARVAREQGDLGRADSLAREAIRAQEALIASAGGDTSQVTSPEASAAEALATLATTKGTLANVLAKQGRYDEALPYMREVLALRRRAVGEVHPRVATAMNNLAFVLGAQGDLAEAEKLRRQALRVHGEALGTEHPRYASDLSNLAVFKYRQGRYEAADSLLQRTLQVEKAHYGEGHPDLGYTLQNLAGVAKARGATGEAVRRYRQALKIRRDTLGEQHPRTLLTLGSLAGMLRQQGKPEQAADTLRKAIRLQREVLGNKHPELAGNLFRLGEILTEQGQYRKALPLYREAVQIQREVRGKRHPKTALVESGLGASLSGLGRYEEAEPLLLKAYDVLAGQDTRDAYMAEARKHLRELYQAWGRPDEAAAYRPSGQQ